MKCYDLLLTRITVTSTENRFKGDKDRSRKTSSEASTVIVGSSGVVAVAWREVIGLEVEFKDRAQFLVIDWI